MPSISVQILSSILIIYILIDFLLNRRKNQLRNHTKIFITLLLLDFIYLSLDFVTVFTVNHLNDVNDIFNRVLHLFFYLSIEGILFLTFRYILAITDVEFKNKKNCFWLYAPFLISVVVACCFTPQIEFIIGHYTNYSLGIPVYVCYAVGAIYVLCGMVVFFARWKYIHKTKRRALTVCLAAIIAVLVFQFPFPELLISSAGVAMITLGFYMNIEDNDKTELQEFQKEMLHSFADLVETRDGNTGQHIKRTTEYVRIIAEQLRKGGKYASSMSKDYIDMLMQAAPMHDIGKMAIKDSILLKPGKLTEEEYKEIQSHTTEGEKIIRKSFKNVGNKECIEIARLTALYHHEKWNGKGYPKQIFGDNIPLCARIMAVADVFDAVSQDRCYRKAMTLDESFDLIKDGIGTDFDPEIALAFIAARSEVEKIYHNWKE